MEKSTIVISAFPGTGKSTFFSAIESLRKKGLEAPIVMDSDSSMFSWIKPGERHPDFPNNYIAHIKENIGKADIIMVSTHKVVRDALRDAGIHFILVYPVDSAKNEYMERYRVRNSPEAFLKLMDDKWDDFISELKAEPEDKILLAPKQFLSDIIISDNSMHQQFLSRNVNLPELCQ